VNRKQITFAALIFTGISTGLDFAQEPREAATARPGITISVHDYADVPPSQLMGAEAEARRIFWQAGVETEWVSCSPKLEEFEPDICSRVDATHLVLKVISDKTNAHMRDRGDVLGNALLAGDGTGYYAYAFQDHIGILEQKLGFAVLGYVLTHEVGHLLLGSNSHAVNGIMSPHWNGAELRRISEGTLLFLPSESRMLRERMRRHGVDVAPIVASAKAIAEAN
jgi:hypothetical protein